MTRMVYKRGIYYSGTIQDFKEWIDELAGTFGNIPLARLVN